MNAAGWASTGVVAALALVLGGWLKYNGNCAKTSTALFLVAGTGIGGVLGTLLGRVFTTLSGATSTVTQLLGVAGGTVLAAVCVIATLEVVVKGIVPKTARPKSWHPWLALTAPTLAVASGAPLLAGFYSVLARGVGGAGAVASTWITG
ncbi:hypothetical protein [Pseudonocardia sp. ICBG601]|uniref:hypothetical protein n=1 Tax=Pseudonocardia sp. ICBG601 TaxID=2846759 RepID=UPI001CF609C8|nr:hypothetical protein [Pseudonocardia sp. ICBG601]